MVDRVIIARRPADGRASVTAGRIRYRKPPDPDEGNHFSLTPSTRIKTSPSQNWGTDSPNKLTLLATRSILEPGRNAAAIPNRSPSTNASAIAATKSSAVYGNLAPITSKAGRSKVN